MHISNLVCTVYAIRKIGIRLNILHGDSVITICFDQLSFHWSIEVYRYRIQSTMLAYPVNADTYYM